MPHEFRTQRMVQFAETDCAGIIHFTSYFRYMEEVEHAFLRSLGLSVQTEVEGGIIGFPRLASTCEFKSPSRFEDVLDVHLSVKRKGRTSLTYHLVFTLKGKEVARGENTVVCCLVRPDHTFTPVPLPESMAQRIQEAPQDPAPKQEGEKGGRR